MPRYRGTLLLHEREALMEPPDESTVRALLDGLLGALEAFHTTGHSHGNVTPSSILVLDDGRPLLLGPSAAARAIADDGANASVAEAESGFAPIEQIVEPDVEPPYSADLYALAGVARYWMSGQLPAPALRGADAARPESVASITQRLAATWPHLHYGASLLDALDRYQQQAFEVVTRGVAEAFDLSREDKPTLARYDTSHLFDNREVQRWGDMRRSTNLLGKQMLLARRLCEAGCGFVTVSDCGWDMHANGNSPKQMALMPALTSQVDHAVAAFIEDVHERGLSDRILLVVTGEMGRTPRRNRDGGRDHYPNLTTLAFAGGRLKMGQVIGQSDRLAAQPSSERYTPKHLLATVMHTLLDIGEVRVRSGLGRVATVLADGEPIPGLI